jgi:coniferyl-aldehyde dehydrogenase
MRDERRPRQWFLPGSKTCFSRFGVVGIIAPNYPAYLAAGPLVAALAAGNGRAKLPNSRFHARRRFCAAAQKHFADDEASVVINGDATVAAEFWRLPFDHLLFTRSTSSAARERCGRISHQ